MRDIDAKAPNCGFDARSSPPHMRRIFHSSSRGPDKESALGPPRAPGPPNHGTSEGRKRPRSPERCPCRNPNGCLPWFSFSCRPGCFAVRTGPGICPFCRRVVPARRSRWSCSTPGARWRGTEPSPRRNRKPRIGLKKSRPTAHWRLWPRSILPPKSAAQRFLWMT